MQDSQDEKYINLAIDLAKKVNPAPNPKVGCVIVKNNKIIGQGYHKKYGQAHAEIIAIKQAGEQAKNATMYVSLEPCCTHGKTPPCTDAVIKSGIKKVIIGCRDVNKKNNKGAEILTQNNIQVKIVNNKKAIKLNEAFNKFITKKIPFVTIKSAVSLDGKIALDNGKSQWITNAKSRKKVHELRNKFQAILTGANTIIKDNPRLTCRLKGGENPIIIIVDSQLKILRKSKALKPGTIIATTKYANQKKLNCLKKQNIDIIIIKEKNKQVDLKSLMRKLAKKGISNILVEAGQNLTSSLIKEKLVDKIYFFIAPKILGSKMSAINSLNFKSMDKIIKLKNIKIEQFNDNIMVEGYF